MGLVQIVVGMAVKFWMLCRDGQIMDAVWDVGTWWVIFIGIGLFAVTTAFAFITLPVEFDASARALKWLDRSHLMNYFDHGKAKSALFWAAMTYVVGALSSLAMLLYYVFIFLNARGRE